MSTLLPRREFIESSAAAMAGLALANRGAAQAPAADRRYQFCAFTKYMQTLNADQLGAAVAAIEMTGIEAPVRRGGHFSMEEAPDKLPPFVEALKRHGVEVTILCTDVLAVDTPGAEACLRTAQQVGISHYRMGSYRYDLARPVLAQLAEIRPALAELAALNREIGIQGLYQNHCGADVVGAAVWDIYNQIADLPSKDLALAFDIRHATVEAGLAWPAVFNAVQEHIGAVFVKDFVWDGARAENAPLGQGRVDPEFFKLLARSNFAGPVSVHVEYLEDQDAAVNAAAISRDFETLKSWLPGS
jgi:sugar phosphate isomerase/epimerase